MPTIDASPRLVASMFSSRSAGSPGADGVNAPRVTVAASDSCSPRHSRSYIAERKGMGSDSSETAIAMLAPKR